MNGNLCNSDAMYKQSLFLGNSRMVPDNIAPSCEKRHIHVENCKNNSLKVRRIERRDIFNESVDIFRPCSAT